MDLDGDFTEPDFRRHLLIHQPRGDKRHDLPFARRELLEQSPQLGKRLFAVASFAVPFDRLCDGVEHVLMAKRLCQEIDRSCFHSPDGHRDVSMTRYHDNGDMNVRIGQLSLEVETAHSGQPDVEHKAAWRVRELLLQEFRRRAEPSWLKADRSEQAAQRIANLRVVINDEDDGRLGKRVIRLGRSSLGHDSSLPHGNPVAWIAAPLVRRTAVGQANREFRRQAC